MTRKIIGYVIHWQEKDQNDRGQSRNVVDYSITKDHVVFRSEDGRNVGELITPNLYWWYAEPIYNEHSPPIDPDDILFDPKDIL